MDLDYDKAVRLGQTLGPLITSEAFKTAVEVIKDDFQQGILNSRPTELQTREMLYHEYKGFERIVATLHSFVAAAQHDAQQAELEFDNEDFQVIN